MTSRDAAEVLSLSERQIKRLKAGVKKDGEVFVIHKNRGRKPKHTIPGEIREEIVFLPGFIKRFNARFAVVPREPQSAYRPLEEDINLDYILCRKKTRKACHGSIFSFGGQIYQLSKNNKVVTIPNKAAITVLTSPKFGMRAEYKGGVYQVRKAVRPAKAIAKKDRIKRSIKVKDDHPWKNGSIEHFTYEESDRELVAAIYNTKGWE